MKMMKVAEGRHFAMLLIVAVREIEFDPSMTLSLTLV